MFIFDVVEINVIIAFIIFIIQTYHMVSLVASLRMQRGRRNKAQLINFTHIFFTHHQFFGAKHNASLRQRVSPLSQSRCQINSSNGNKCIPVSNQNSANV